MARGINRSGNGAHLGRLVLANILIPISILLFATGFFPYKPFLSGLATFEQIESSGAGLRTSVENARPKRVFDKVIFMVVDALRSDFVYGRDSGFVFTQSLIRTGAAVPFTAHAAPPTVTMPRVKGLTTGSVPSFLDLILNFAESDTSSSLSSQDTWLAQIKAHLKSPGEDEGKLVFYGDDTWLKLFPDFFHRTDGTSSFFVSDFTEVDNNVTRHLPYELAQSDWNAMIMHYLGLDHIGHKSGPLSPHMLPKQEEMDGIVYDIYEAIDTLPHLDNTLLVLAGDHGMNAGGNHGGSAAGETSPALVFISPKLRQITCDAVLQHNAGADDDDTGPSDRIQPRVAAASVFAAEQAQRLSKADTVARQKALAQHLTQAWADLDPADRAVYQKLASRDAMRYEEDRAKAYCRKPVDYKSPTSPKDGTEFEYYRQIEQSDLVPTLAALLGVPISKNNLGIIIPEILQFWTRHESEQSLRSDQQLLYRNALQLITILKAAYGEDAFEVSSTYDSNLDTAASCDQLVEGVEQLSCKWRTVQRASHGEDLLDHALTDFLKTAQDTLSATASSYNVTNLVGGTIVAIIATVIAISSRKNSGRPSAGILGFTSVILLYGAMMFASSYVEEEQHFWYWMSSAWFLCLYFIRPLSSSTPDAEGARRTSNVRAAVATIVLLATHRLITRWNQTGQKHAGAPDVAHHYFLNHHIFLWVLILLTYVHMSYRFARRTFSKMASPELAVMTSLSLTVPSLIFKLNFTQADAPELIQDLAQGFRDYTAQWDLVSQARATFSGMGVAVVAIILLMHLREKWLSDDDDNQRIVPLPQRLHDLLTVFLMTQTRAQNIPLYLIFEIQLQLLKYLLAPPSSSAIEESDTTLTSQEPALAQTKSSSHDRGALPSSQASPSTITGKFYTTAAPIPSVLPATLSILLMAHTSYFALGGSNAISSIDLGNAYNGISGYNVLAVGVLLFCSNWAGPIWWSLGSVMLIQRLRDGDAADDYDDLEDDDAVVRAMLKNETAEEKEARIKMERRKKWIEMERNHLAQQSVQPPSASSSARRAEIEQREMDKKGLWADHLATLTIFVCAGLVAVMAACTALRTHLFIWTVFSPKYLYAMAWGLAWHLIINIALGSVLYRLGRR
ncbi:hypothetical protein AAFC00_003382 [Neodothiora populina]|uniref:GPI ethanolamine phosphate transferase 2 n=1 Tax=Neodothiora populina TaxID=2781224 RepID=A0ABR3PE32_9PEZI